MAAPKHLFRLVICYCQQNNPVWFDYRIHHSNSDTKYWPDCAVECIVLSSTVANCVWVGESNSYSPILHPANTMISNYDCLAPIQWQYFCYRYDGCPHSNNDYCYQTVYSTVQESCVNYSLLTNIFSYSGCFSHDQDAVVWIHSMCGELGLCQDQATACQ